MGILISEVEKLSLAVYNRKNYFSWTVAKIILGFCHISCLYSECVTEDNSEEKLLLALLQHFSFSYFWDFKTFQLASLCEGVTLP